MHKDRADGSWGDHKVHKEGVIGLGASEKRRRNQIFLELSEGVLTIFIPLKALCSTEGLEEGKTMLHRFRNESTQSRDVAHQVLYIGCGPRWGEI